jgi:hypothetical protein
VAGLHLQDLHEQNYSLLVEVEVEVAATLAVVVPEDLLKPK